MNAHCGSCGRRDVFCRCPEPTWVVVSYAIGFSLLLAWAVGLLLCSQPVQTLFREQDSSLVRPPPAIQRIPPPPPPSRLA